MRLASHQNVASLLGLFALCSVLTGCPEKGTPADKPTAEQPERAEPDDEGKAATDTKKPLQPAPAPAAAPAADDKKPDDDKDKGGW
jgi:hypothetical protein